MTLRQFQKAVRDGKAVVGAIPTGRHMPAAFIASMQFWRVAAALPQMKIYKPKSKTK